MQTQVCRPASHGRGNGRMKARGTRRPKNPAWSFRWPLSAHATPVSSKNSSRSLSFRPRAFSSSSDGRDTLTQTLLTEDTEGTEDTEDLGFGKITCKQSF